MITDKRCPLGKYLNEYEINPRFDIWLYHYLKLQPGSQLQQTFGSAGNPREALAAELTRLDISRETVLEARKLALVPRAVFEWFEDSERFFLWLLGQSNHNASAELRYYGSKQLSHLDACIALIDHSENQLQEKLLKLSGYKLEWQNRRQIGREFSWVDGDNEEEKARLVCNQIAAIRPLMSSLQPSAPPVYYRLSETGPKTSEDLLILVDRLKITHFEAKLASKEAKAKWSQLKYRSNKTKSQLNVHIATKTTERLAAIAEKHHLSKAKVIEYLINAESEKGLYIPEKMAAWLRGDVE